ncbi:MAG: DoxX family protein [Desulforhopalus sp.]|nr:DoxX family protein [Desulforhopalus sp.]
MLTRFLDTRDELSSTILRITLGLVILPHGLQKVFGLFGGHGFAGTLHFFTENMGIPYIFALMAVLAESLGAVGLITGLFTRLCAFGVGVTIGVAALMVHIPNGFFMNWFGKQAGEGFEYHILVVGMALTLMFTGGGRWSFDALIVGNDKSNKQLR